jgi:hypothetical protein
LTTGKHWAGGLGLDINEHKLRLKGMKKQNESLAKIIPM